MTNSKSTKRALASSILATFMCVAMLVGMTFAWFTDTASTGVNKIVSGKLDVDLEMAKEWNEDGTVKTWESADGKTLTFKTTDNRSADRILWEPGCTYELPELRVVNNGNLALKYKIQITGIQGDAKLNEVIDWTINDEKIDLTEGKLEADEKGAGFKIKGKMQETAGNEYQGLSIDGIAITVYATQDTVEYDSFNNTYDANATYPAGAMIAGLNGNYETLTEAAMAWRESKGVVTSGDQMGANSIGTVDNVTWLISGKVAVGDGKDVTGTSGSVLGLGYFYPAVTFNNITITGVGTDSAITGGSVRVGGKNVVFENIKFTDEVRIDSNPSTLTFKNCTFENGLRIPHSASNAELVVENCKFINDGTHDYAIFVQGNNVATAKFVGNEISGYMRGMNIELGNNAVVTIEKNRIHDLTGMTENGYTYGSAIQMTTAKSFSVKENTITNVPANAFHIYSVCTASISFIGNTVENAKYLCWNEANNTNITSSGNTVTVSVSGKATNKTEEIASDFTLN